MRVLFLDPIPSEVAGLLEKWRSWGDGRDWEVWEGVLHVRAWPDGSQTPATSADTTVADAGLRQRLAELLGPAARASGLMPVIGPFRVGSEGDYRVPDGAVLRGVAAKTGMSVALVLEVVAPGDGTADKLSFYAIRGVEEVVIVDPREREVQWLALGEDGEYGSVERSGLIALGPTEVAGQIGWT